MCSECSRTAPEARPHNSIDRRDFLRLSGTGLAGAVLLGSAGGRVFAQAGTSLKSEFESAAAEHDVPEELLMAMGYVNTLWEMPPPEASDYEPGDLHGRGTYGIMQLVRTPWEDTVGLAADLTGLPEERLKSERAANVGGGAAVLADIAGEERPPELDGWYGTVAEYGGNDLYAQRVFGVLEDGASATISTGGSLNLAPQEVDTPQLLTSRSGGADYRRADWRPAYRGNYSKPRSGRPYHRLHSHPHSAGSYSGTISWFKDWRANVSAHYVVGRTGRVAQCVRNEDIAWHAGNWTYNRKSIGIEHAGYAGQRWTDSTYRSSARLSAYLSKRFNIPVDRRYIRGHGSVPGVATRCPGRRFNWDRSTLGQALQVVADEQRRTPGGSIHHPQTCSLSLRGPQNSASTARPAKLES